MGRARIAGEHITISVKNASNQDIKIGEVDKFTAKKLDELKKAKPLGEHTSTSWVRWEGWELTFDGGKVDWMLATTLHAQDLEVSGGRRSPYFDVNQKITYLDGVVEEYKYPEVTIYGYELDAPQEDMTEKFSGYTGKSRTLISAAGGNSNRTEDIAKISALLGTSTAPSDSTVAQLIAVMAQNGKL